jgi:hypothetical protein
MTPFTPITFDYARSVKEVAEFRVHLDSKDQLDERKDVLRFFRDRPQLCAMCAVLSPLLGDAVDRYAREFSLFGELTCDLVLGDSKRMTHCFIEFEGAGPDSIFKSAGKKVTRDWSSKFEHGYSQVIDWFHKLSKMAEHEDFEKQFFKRSSEYDGALVVGRTKGLVLNELARLEWRRNNVVVNSKKIRCVTYDELLGMMLTRLDMLAALSPPTPTST